MTRRVKINGFNLAEESQLALIVPRTQSSELANGGFAREATLRHDDCEVLHEKEKEVFTRLLDLRVSGP